MYNYHVQHDKFNTDAVITLLQEYQPDDSDELAAKKQMLEFVLNNSDFYKRSLLIGHTTASAWIVDEPWTDVLLTHHAKLDRWMQLGGHIEEDADIQSAALREAKEESGLTSLQLASRQIFDIDIHEIPASAKAPAHLHYDIRFLLIADRSEPLSISSESKSLDWRRIENVTDLSSERSVLRMVEKSLSFTRHDTGSDLP